MKYNSICTICGRETLPCESIAEHMWVKEKEGFINVQVSWGLSRFRSIDFCLSCAKKSYTIEELKVIDNYNQWSY